MSTGSGPAPRSALTEVRNVLVANEIQHSPAAQVVLGQALLGEALHGVEAAALLGGEQQLSLDAPPDTPTCIRRWSESSSIVGVRFERDYLHPEMSRLLAESARRLPEHLDLTERAAANWLQLVRSLSLIRLRALAVRGGASFASRGTPHPCRLRGDRLVMRFICDL